jgi:hypothetical protein
MLLQVYDDWPRYRGAPPHCHGILVLSIAVLFYLVTCMILGTTAVLSIWSPSNPMTHQVSAEERWEALAARYLAALARADSKAWRAHQRTLGLAVGKDAPQPVDDQRVA